MPQRLDEDRALLASGRSVLLPQLVEVPRVLVRVRLPDRVGQEVAEDDALDGREDAVPRVVRRLRHQRGPTHRLPEVLDEPVRRADQVLELLVKADAVPQVRHGEQAIGGQVLKGPHQGQLLRFEVVPAVGEQALEREELVGNVRPHQVIVEPDRP